MSRRGISVAAILLAAAVNGYCGAAKIMAFRHRYAGQMALTEADLNRAYTSFRYALFWQPDDAQSHILIGRVITHAQANGLPLEPLEGRQPIEMLGIGVAAASRGIALNPADAWGWFGLGDLYLGYRRGRIRLERMKMAGRSAAGAGGDAAAGPVAAADAGRPGSLSREEAVAVAAVRKALELEPDYFFYHDFLARLYRELGFKAEAATEIRESFANWPPVESHPILEDPELVRDLADPILEGIERSASSPYIGPVMAARARARILDQLDRYPEAVAAYELLRRIGDEGISAECDLALGTLEQRRGRFEESLPHLDSALRTAPDSPQGIWALYYKGVARARLGDDAGAVEMYRAHLEKAPDSLAGYMALAETLERIGQITPAERTYIAAVRRFPRDASTYRRAIEHLRKHGKARQALLYAEALRKVDPDAGDVESLILELTGDAASNAP